LNPSGIVDDPAATVVVNAIAAPVANGVFTLTLPLAEGPNTVTATATASSPSQTGGFFG
jgi:Glucodextranase, domain B